MAMTSQFQSRQARVTCTGEEYFSFITDMRNFGQFIPGKSVEGWKADENSCRINMNPMGEISLEIVSRIPCSEVSFAGTVLVTTGFVLHVYISEEESGKALVSLLMESDLNPMLRAMASGPIERFLEILVTEMENFRGWRR
ncbi:MAG: hypothetical protein ABR974_03240 [Bacteroidales bacterium]|jgi:carbon monoxide dehydrogenase subunit G